MKPILYIVIPCYNEEEVLPITKDLFLNKLKELISKEKISDSSRVMFVNDGSKDSTWEIIKKLALEDEHFIGITQSRNRGHQNAVLAGLMEAKDKCDITISIDCDGQDDINAMNEMVDEYLEGSEIVYGVRSKRDTDTFFKRATAEGFYKVLNIMGAEVVFNHADYRLVSSRVLNEFANFKEVNLFLRGMFPLVGFKSTSVYYERNERIAGESHYPLKKMLALAFLGMAASILVGLLASRVGAGVGRRLRENVFRKVVGFSNAEFDKFSTASLITRSTNDIQQIQLLLVMILRMVLYAPIMAIGGIWKVFHTNVDMSWIIGLAVAVIIVIVGFLFLVVMPKFKLIQNQVDKLNLVSREILTGLSVIRAFSREKFEEKRFDEANRNLMKTQLFTNRVMTFMMPAMMLIMNCVTVMIVWFGAKGIDAGNLQVGDMMAFMTYTMQIVMSFLMITMVSVMLPRAGVAADRIEEILRTDSSIVDAKKTEDEKLTQCRGELRFEDVSFKYPGAEGDVLEHISFTAKPGQTTAVIGSTGCGKSTLIQLIPRFYDVTEGKITLDGVDIRNLSQHKLREVMGLVPQKGVLFSGTIASNIKLAGEDEISDETMKEAAQTAQATEFIDAKPEGYDSPVAQGGSNVSGGQKQRLAIARVIAKHPKVYLFDDSFSALDYKTDAALRKALHEQAADATVLIVAQRISTIMNAEQILVLEDGKIVGKGTHEELMKNCSAYQEIARSQLSESELKGGMAE